MSASSSLNAVEGERSYDSSLIRATKMTNYPVRVVEHSLERLIERSHEAFIGSPSLGDERRGARSDNWRGQSERRSSATFGERRCAACRLYADWADHFGRDRLPDSMQGVYRTTPWSGRRAETRRGGRKE